MPKWALANSMDLYLYPRRFEPLFRELFGKAARFRSRQKVEIEQAFLLVLLDRHSKCIAIVLTRAKPKTHYCSITHSRHYRYLLWVLQNALQLSETDEAWAEKLLPANAPEECYMPHKKRPPSR